MFVRPSIHLTTLLLNLPTWFCFFWQIRGSFVVGFITYMLWKSSDRFSKISRFSFLVLEMSSFFKGRERERELKKTIVEIRYVFERLL